LQCLGRWANIGPWLLIVEAFLGCFAPAVAAGTMPFNSSDHSDGVESAWLYGNINRYAYYFADLRIGSSAQRVSVIVDTGSRLVGFPCKGCPKCGHHIDPAFDTASSQSFKWLPCGVTSNPAWCEGHCCYSETYSEGSTIRGFWFKDMVQLGDSFTRNPPVQARMGCHRAENKLFYTQRANGIMGLAPSYPMLGGNSSRPTFLQDLFRDKPHVSSEMFSICLATWGGKLTVGGYDCSRHINPQGLNANCRSHNSISASHHCTLKRPCHNDGTKWIRMRATHYYFVFPKAMVLEGKDVARNERAFGVTIIDSGTTYTYFPGPMFRNLQASLHSYCQEHQGCGAQVERPHVGMAAGSECWRLLDSAAGPQWFPTLALEFDDGQRIDWPPRRYLHQRGDPNVWCQTFMENNLDQTVLGISWMIHKDIIFDLTPSQQRLGVAEAQCPDHVHRMPSDLEEEKASLANKVSWGKIAAGRARHSIESLTAASIVFLTGAMVVCGLSHICARRRLPVEFDATYGQVMQAQDGSILFLRH